MHRLAEEKVGLPDSVRTQGDYVALLKRLLTFHRSFEQAIANPIWAEEWNRIGINLGEHSRATLLLDDLSSLSQVNGWQGVEVEASSGFATFAEALGGLYVIEGSSLGGKVLAPLFRARLGEIPTRFYESYGRNHPQPWRNLQTALNRFEENAGNCDEIIAGAAATFNSFGNFLAAPR